MTDSNWAIPGVNVYLGKPTAASEANTARIAQQRTAYGTPEEIRAQREREAATLRARHATMLAAGTDPIVHALIEAHSPDSADVFPGCAACPTVYDEYDSGPESWPCGVWSFISDRMETP